MVITIWFLDFKGIPLSPQCWTLAALIIEVTSQKRWLAPSRLVIRRSHTISAIYQWSDVPVFFIWDHEV